MVARRVLLIGSMALVLGVAGCSLLFRYDDIVGPPGPAVDGGSSRDGEVEVDGEREGAADGSCASTCGTPGCGDCPTVAEIEVPSPNGTFRIDAYEVKNADYRAWLRTAPTLSGQRSECAEFNESYVPGVVSPRTLDALADAGVDVRSIAACTNGLETGDDRPVTCVDWCDAVSYCTWARKHLCGRITATADRTTIDVTSPNGSHANPDVSEWYRACSQEGRESLPYGGEFQLHACNDENVGPADVGSHPACEGGYPGLFDMSGNVSEWEDACTHYPDRPSPAQSCLRRGGAFWSQPSDLTCESLNTTYRGLPYNSVGFRCCSGPG